MARLKARETDTNADLPCNLASAGRYQNGKGLVPVKRLKKVTLEFGSVEGRYLFFLVISRVSVSGPTRDA